MATTALLSVHSAHRALVSGRGDALIVQNVMVTVELGALILLAFVLKRRRKLHGAFLASTAILFMGIALFFTLLSFVPQFRIEGPDTFYRFESAAATIQVVCAVVVIAPLTEFVGSRSQAVTFIASFALLSALLAATGIRAVRPAVQGARTSGRLLTVD